ncbi:Uncharacterised protein [Legionella donaldsonii]|uniref:Swiss Army Knife 2H phosphoesterase domain-containing protein n=1 Tax=Legionella donaldsonii TaxID=45060 RepID=A0A378IXX5_9GAMM|nr:hypothetical protein [Legionella donaldsonii]STX40312.1 Uncharacterised protein [Legionella donaldsonii]
MDKFEKIIVTELAGERVLQVTNQLAAEGVIQQRDNFCYLKINDDYIHHTHPYLNEYGVIEKPAYFIPPDDVGAHISVIYPEEANVPQRVVGQLHSFSICGLLKAQYGSREYFALAVSSPSLTTFRQNHHLAEKPIFKGQEIFFHITIGVRDCFENAISTPLRQ